MRGRDSRFARTSRSTTAAGNAVVSLAIRNRVRDSAGSRRATSVRPAAVYQRVPSVRGYPIEPASIKDSTASSSM